MPCNHVYLKPSSMLNRVSPGEMLFINLRGLFPKMYVTERVDTRAANSVHFLIEFEFSLFYGFEFSVFIFVSSSPVNIYQVLSSVEKNYYLEHVQTKLTRAFL